MRRALPFLLLPLALLLMGQLQGPRRRPHIRVVDFTSPPHDWAQFNFDSKHSGDNTAETAIDRENVSTLQLIFRRGLPSVSDSSPVYWAANSRRRRDHVLFFTAQNGSLMAMRADGEMLWSTEPPEGPRWTTSSPVLDPARKFVYSYGLDGRVHKYGITDGVEVLDGLWPVLVTRKPEVEKGSAALSIVTTSAGASYLYAAFSAYPEPGDDGDYQGHVVGIRLQDARTTTFNVLCSGRPFVLGYNDCPARQAGVWGRPGVIYNEADESIYIVTSNGPFSGNIGGTNWGNSILRLPPDLRVHRGKPIDSYTPEEFEILDKQDLDLGSSALAIFPRPGQQVPTLGVHAGKDGVVRMIDLHNMSGRGGPGNVGGELQRLKLPQGGFNFTAPAIWKDAENHTWVYFTNNRGITAFELEDQDGTPQLVQRWRTAQASNSSPVVVNGVLFTARNGKISALDCETGNELWSDTNIGDLHWQSPIVANGAVYLTDLSGNVSAWALPKELVFLQ